MAKKKTKKTPLQIEYDKEYKLLKRRAKSWQKKHRMLYTDMPEKVSKPTRKSIEKIRNIRYSSFSEKEVKKHQTDYEEAYEERVIPDPYEYNIYNPPSEYDYYNSDDFLEDNWWEPTDNEPAKSKEEIDAFIEETIENILDISGIDRPNEYIRDIFSTLLDNLRFSIGDTAFYEYLSDPSTVDELTQAAQTGMATSPTKDTSGAEKQQAQDAISKFTFVLNRHRPLDIYQTEQLEEVVQTHGLDGGVTFEDID